jgi:hypothetical protein
VLANRTAAGGLRAAAAICTAGIAAAGTAPANRDPAAIACRECESGTSSAAGGAEACAVRGERFVGRHVGVSSAASDGGSCPGAEAG